MDGVIVQLDWTGAREVVAQPANVVLVQGLRDEIVVSFGHAPPPVAMATLDEKETVEFIRNNAIKVQQITRISLSLNAARVLMRGLGGVLAVEEDESAPTEGGAEEGS